MYYFSIRLWHADFICIIKIVFCIFYKLVAVKDKKNKTFEIVLMYISRTNLVPVKYTLQTSIFPFLVSSSQFFPLLSQLYPLFFHFFPVCLPFEILLFRLFFFDFYDIFTVLWSTPQWTFSDIVYFVNLAYKFKSYLIVKFIPFFCLIFLN